METIIGLLFILLPVIFKLIGKKFEQSGQTDKAGKMRELAKALGSDDDSEDSPFKGFFDDKSDPEVEYDDDGQIVSVHPKMTWKPEPAPVVMEKQKADPQIHLWEVKEGVATVKKKPILVEEAPKKKREKIDPKKLVVYSEIMKPKF